MTRAAFCSRMTVMIRDTRARSRVGARAGARGGLLISASQDRGFPPYIQGMNARIPLGSAGNLEIQPRTESQWVQPRC